MQRQMTWRGGCWLVLAASCFVGCSQPVPSHPESQGTATAPAPKTVVQTSGHNHSGWWCSEHGVPEAECGRCDPKLAAEFQKKGDWCAEHDRPDSQCFVCHPELEAQFAARYEARYGKKPPKPEG
jgi:hypothetical protein